jgi:hypothetical protein
MKIIIETIPNESQRYPTVGDYYRDAAGTLHIKVSQEIGDKGALLVALHELIEVALCDERGITHEDIDNFDKSFEFHRQDGNTDEPGDDPEAPYKREHFFATSIERLMAAEMGVEWGAYETAINNL